MSCVPVVRVFALLALAFTSAPTLAQQTSRQFIEAGLRATGLSDSDIATWGSIDSQTKTVDQGLVIDRGWVQPRQRDPNSNNAGTLVVLLLNPTGQAWCARGKGAVQGATVQASEVTNHNFVVDPGTSARFAHAVVLPNTSEGFSFDARYEVAVWKPDYSQPYESQCRAVAPEHLDAWLASENVVSYLDFVGNLEGEQEWKEMMEYSDDGDSED